MGSRGAGTPGVAQVFGNPESFTDDHAFFHTHHKTAHLHQEAHKVPTLSARTPLAETLSRGLRNSPSSQLRGTHGNVQACSDMFRRADAQACSAGAQTKQRVWLQQLPLVYLDRGYMTSVLLKCWRVTRRTLFLRLFDSQDSALPAGFNNRQLHGGTFLLGADSFTAAPSSLEQVNLPKVHHQSSASFMRNGHNISVPYARTKRLQQSFLYCAIRLYNNSPSI
ncbi:hypothetical protein Bbelb_312960 [Branchiostoma belcheri]|nr:hypothetical protein Bbelb_312960 [Branchiostoma belcheri]